MCGIKSCKLELLGISLLFWIICEKKGKQRKMKKKFIFILQGKEEESEGV
jgi:hypothetical protein